MDSSKTRRVFLVEVVLELNREEEVEELLLEEKDWIRADELEESKLWLKLRAERLASWKPLATSGG